eukprot:6491430-Amphidinium_carterae.2
MVRNACREHGTGAQILCVVRLLVHLEDRQDPLEQESLWVWHPPKCELLLQVLSSAMVRVVLGRLL